VAKVLTAPPIPCHRSLDRVAVRPILREELAAVDAAQPWRLAIRTIRSRPLHAVCDHAANVRLEVHRVFLVTRAEEEDSPVPALPGASAAEDLTAAERRDEDQFVGTRNIEELPIHLLLLDDDRVRDSLSDRMRRVYGPNQLTVDLPPPAERTGGAHELPEDLGEVPRMQHDQAESGQYVAMDAFDDFVGDLVVCRVTPPDQHIGRGKPLLGQPVLGVVEDDRRDVCVRAEVLFDPLPDGTVHSVRIALGDRRVGLLMPVLTPDDDGDGWALSENRHASTVLSAMRGSSQSWGTVSSRRPRQAAPRSDRARGRQG